MANLSEKSADELSELLDEYGIRHGPIVDSTRSLYEKKLREAMSKAKRSASDKTYFREEVEEEVTYVTRTPARGMSAGDSGSYMSSRPEMTEREYQHDGSYLRSRPERTEREYEPEASYSNYSRAPPDLRGGDYVNKPYTYSSPTSYSSSSYSSPTSYRSSAYLSSTPLKSEDLKTPPPPPAASRSSGLVPPWIQVLFFLVVLILLYIVFSSMEANEPIKGIE